MNFMNICRSLYDDIVMTFAKIITAAVLNDTARKVNILYRWQFISEQNRSLVANLLRIKR